MLIKTSNQLLEFSNFLLSKCILTHHLMFNYLNIPNEYVDCHEVQCQWEYQQLVHAQPHVQYFFIEKNIVQSHGP